MLCHLCGGASMEQFTSRNWPNIVSTNGDQCDRLSATINKLDLIAATSLVNMNDGPHISTVEFFVRRVAVQYDEGMFSNHLSSSGYAVTSRGGSSSSTIQTVSTFPGRWFGRPTDPVALYFIPNDTS